jgi:hypothetical protein
MTPSRSTSPMRRLRARSWRDGASGLRLRQREACFKCATMHRRHGSAPSRIRHPKGGEIMSAGREITPGPLWLGMEAQQ